MIILTELWKLKRHLNFDAVPRDGLAAKSRKSPLVRLAGYVVILTLLVGNTLFSTTVAGTICQPLTIPTAVPLISDNGSSWIYRLAEGQLGGTAAYDSATLELYSPATGTIDLGAGANLNYSTCSQCVLLHQDTTDGVLSKTFFQDAGVLELSAAPGANPMPVVFTNLRLVEVTIDPGTFQSTPVPGGECYVGTIDDDIFVNGFEN